MRRLAHDNAGRVVRILDPSVLLDEQMDAETARDLEQLLGETRREARRTKTFWRVFYFIASGLLGTLSVIFITSPDASLVASGIFAFASVACLVAAIKEPLGTTAATNSQTIHLFLRANRCPCCKHSLAGLEKTQGDVVSCPECASQWVIS